MCGVGWENMYVQYIYNYLTQNQAGINWFRAVNYEHHSVDLMATPWAYLHTQQSVTIAEMHKIGKLVEG